MFEYAFVYGKEEGVELTEIYLEELLEELEQNREFLELKGFSVQTEFLAEEGKIMGNVMFFQRIFSNLFTNILKYADQDQSIVWTVKVDRGMLCFLFWNQKLRSRKLVESNGIGLKSVRRMVELQNGSVFMTGDGDHFALTMKFPLI
jgi:Signal transduction histidine kinase